MYQALNPGFAPSGQLCNHWAYIPFLSSTLYCESSSIFLLTDPSLVIQINNYQNVHQYIFHQISNDGFSCFHFSSYCLFSPSNIFLPSSTWSGLSLAGVNKELSLLHRQGRIPLGIPRKAVLPLGFYIGSKYHMHR